MNSKKFTSKKNKAQAMVEFAIALPILLMLLYGILEVGRLLFTYSSVVNATRQAVRWGSTTGQGDGGIPGNTIAYPRYQDCDGIRASAQRGDYLNVFDDEDIIITYDTGPGTPDSDTCDGSYDINVTLPTGNAANTARIRVTIDYDFKALVPKLVPFVSRTMNAESARTIVSSITINEASGGLPKKDATIYILDVPDPSEIGQTVKVVVIVNGEEGTPTGDVTITSADMTPASCSFTLVDGSGFCPVSFTSAGLKTITATYSGDTTYNGDSNVETHQVNLAYSKTTITTDTPDPSVVNETVNVSVAVTSGAWAGIPTGTVNITGTDMTPCSLTLSASGTGSCTVIFTSAGTKTITATYSGDATHLGSSDTEAHTVLLSPPTATLTSTPGPTPTPTITPTPLPPSCSVAYTVNSWSNGFAANIVITNNGSTTINGWTLTWNYTAGQEITNMWNATYAQSAGAVSVTDDPITTSISPNGGTQQFGFQGTYNNNNPSPTSFSLNGVLCTGGAVLPTPTLTATLLPTVIPTNVSCVQLSRQTNPSLSYSGATMSMEIYNQTGVVLTIQDVQVTWNHDKGRGGGSDGRELWLKSAILESTIFWSGNQNAPSYTITPSPSISIPIGTSKISFKFDNNYVNLDGSERIFINFATPGCGFLDSND
jgi:Flp pilus assembly protein TadG